MSLIEALKDNKTLTTLKFSGYKLGYVGAIALAKVLNNTKLTTLIINRNEIFTSGGKALAEALQVNNTLKILDISSNFLKSSEDFAHMLTVNKTLVELNINANNIDNVELLAEALADNKTLKTLDISSNNVTDKNKLLNMIQNNKTLTTLIMNNIEFFQDDRYGMSKSMIDIIEALKTNTSLLELDITSTKIGDEGANALAKVLGKGGNKTLEKLHTCLNYIRNVTQLTEALKNNTSLLKLYISDNSIRPQGIEDFANMLKVNKTLSFIDMDNLFRTFPDDDISYLGNSIRSIRLSLRNNQRKVVNNVTILSSLYPDEQMNQFFIYGIRLQDQYKAGDKKLTFNSETGTISLNSNHMNKFVKQIGMREKSGAFGSKKNLVQPRERLSAIGSRANLTSKKTNSRKSESSVQMRSRSDAVGSKKHLVKTNNQFFTDNKNISDEATLSLLLYFPLIQSFINNEKLIFNLRKSGSSEEIMHYIDTFNKIVANHSKKQLPPEIWQKIFSYLNTDDLQTIRKALTFK
jgi:Ran GTPase-activating protein (RanGAP) involved in mRNA processing and transport